jgi:hypothetical protein
MAHVTLIVVLLSLTLINYGQPSRTITGIAVDKSNTPIPFCNVSIKGTKNQAITNSCGEFQLTTTDREFTITFNCLATHDFLTFEKRFNSEEIGESKTIRFKLKRHNKIKTNECTKPIDKKLKTIKVF